MSYEEKFELLRNKLLRMESKKNAIPLTEREWGIISSVYKKGYIDGRDSAFREAAKLIEESNPFAKRR